MAIVSGKQSLGQRDGQEDALKIVFDNESDPESSILMLLSDGMGGHVGGEIASNLVLAEFAEHFTRGSQSPKPRQRLSESLTTANAALAKRVVADPTLKGMGCTLVAALRINDRLVWLSVGDSLLYRLRDGTLERLNADHSYYGELVEMVKAGKISQADADQHPRRNALRSALVGEKISMVDIDAVDMQAGDLIVLASDGLDTLKFGELEELLRAESKTDVRSITAELLNAVEAKNKPKQDNTTVIAYRHSGSGTSAMMPSTWSGMGAKKIGKNGFLALIAGGIAVVLLLVVAAVMFSGSEPTSDETITVPALPDPGRRSIDEPGTPVDQPVETPADIAPEGDPEEGDEGAIEPPVPEEDPPVDEGAPADDSEVAPAAPSDPDATPSEVPSGENGISGG